MEVGVLVGWEPRSLEPRIFTKCGHVRKGQAGLLAKGQASAARYGRRRAAPVTSPFIPFLSLSARSKYTCLILFYSTLSFSLC